MPEVTRTPVQSSSIASLGHDAESDTLHVEFNSGRIYEYSGINTEAYQRLLNAPSIGAHFGRHIRPRFDGKAIS